MQTNGACFICCSPATTHCSQCKDVFYCCRQCQLADWRRHKIDCGTILKFAPMDVSDKYGFLQKGMVLRESVKVGEILYDKKPYLFLVNLLNSSDVEDEILHLDKCEHRASDIFGEAGDLALELCVLLLVDDPKRARKILEQCDKSPAPRKIFSRSPDVIFQKMTTLLIHTKKTIDFAFWKPDKIGLLYDHVVSYYFSCEMLDLNVLGVAYDPLIGSINHACHPNALTRILPDRIVLIAKRDMEAGEELTISYYFTAFGIFGNSILNTSVQANCGFDCVCDVHRSVAPHFSPGPHSNELQSIFVKCEKEKNVAKRLKMMWKKCKDHRTLIPGNEGFDVYSAFKVSYYILINAKQLDQQLNPEIGVWAASIMKYSSEQNTVDNCNIKNMVNWETFKYHLLNSTSINSLKTLQQGKQDLQFHEDIKLAVKSYVDLKKTLLDICGNREDIVEQIFMSSTFFLPPFAKIVVSNVILKLWR